MEIDFIKQQIENIRAKAKSLRDEIIEMQTAGMDTRRHQKVYEDYINKDIELTALLREAEKDETP